MAYFDIQHGARFEIKNVTKVTNELKDSKNDQAGVGQTTDSLMEVFETEEKTVIEADSPRPSTAAEPGNLKQAGPAKPIESEEAENMRLLMMVVEQSESSGGQAGAGSSAEARASEKESVEGVGIEDLLAGLPLEERRRREADFLKAFVSRAHGSERLDEFQQLLNLKEDQIQSLLEKYKGLQGEFDGFKKRLDRERREAGRGGVESVLRPMLCVLDNLERAVVHVQESKDPLEVEEGIKMIHRQLLGALSEAGLKKVDALGAKFDPAFHEAVVYIENGEVPPNTVISVYEEGYLLQDRLLRPAKVVISRGVGSTN